MLGAGRALLLQLAHPSVAAGVDEHSDFQRQPFKRLLGTLEATYAMVFGTIGLAEGVGRRVQRIHDFVASAAYRANDPDNLLWVHATLLDSALGAYERLVRPLTVEERETYYQEMTVVAQRFGCPRSRQPADHAAFRAYWDEAVSSVTVTDTGRRLARDVVSPRLPWRLDVPLAPALALQRLVAVGTLPPTIRSQFGFAWSERHERRLERFLSLAGAVNRAVPRPARVAPVHAHGRLVLLPRARRHVEAAG